MKTQNTKTPRHTLVVNRLGFSGADIAGQKLQADKHGGNALAMIKQVATAFIDGSIKQADIVYSANDYRFAIRANNVTSKGVLGYYSDQLKKTFKKLGYDSKPTQKDGVYKSWKIEKLAPADNDSTPADSTPADNAGALNDGNGIEHAVISDRLDVMLQAGVTPALLIREVLNLAMDSSQHAEYLLALATEIDNQVPLDEVVKLPVNPENVPAVNKQPKQVTNDDSHRKTA